MFVLDIESMQKIDEPANKFVHEFVLMCVRNVYDETMKWEFKSISSFIQMCENDPVFEDALFLAHNGGGYDYQFLISECEHQNIDFATFIQFSLPGKKTHLHTDWGMAQ